MSLLTLSVTHACECADTLVGSMLDGTATEADIDAYRAARTAAHRAIARETRSIDDPCPAPYGWTSTDLHAL